MYTNRELDKIIEGARDILSDARLLISEARDARHIKNSDEEHTSLEHYSIHMRLESLSMNIEELISDVEGAGAKEAREDERIETMGNEIAVVLKILTTDLAKSSAAQRAFKRSHHGMGDDSIYAHMHKLSGDIRLINAVSEELFSKGNLLRACQNYTSLSADALELMSTDAPTLADYLDKGE